MKFSAHAMTVGTFAPMLTSLSNVLAKGAEHARAKNLDPAILVNARLAPDMFPLSLQVQIASTHAAETTARLMGAELPKFENTEKTIEELVARVGNVIAYVAVAPESAFEGAEEREIVLPLPVGNMALEMKGWQFLRDWALPHFYFHVVTAYDILRHNGVEIGKRDYLAHVGPYIRQRS
jgi:hypothetical protein